MAKEYKVSLNQRNSDKLETLATKLGVNKKDIIEKGLKLMELYAQQEENDEVSINVKKQNGEINNYVLL